MKPYYEHAGITIYHGDCRDVLPQLESASVDICLTSPPYNVGLKYLGYNDDALPKIHLELNRAILTEGFRLGSDGCRFYGIVSDDMIFWFRPLAEEIGWTWGQMLAWLKPNFASAAGKITGDWNYMAEWILLFRKGSRVPMLNGESNTHNWFVIPTPQSTWNDEPKQHPAQYPEELPKRILSRTPGERILDPFMGSGTTLRAAKDLGRRAIGIEIEEKYCEIAAKRLSQEVFDFSAAGK